LLAMWIQASR